MSKITVIGSTNIDLIMKLDELPVKGETVTGGEFIQFYGGKGANQAVGAARAGGDVSFISCVGDDHYGKQCKENFEKDGINTRYIITMKNVPTGSALIMVDKQGDNMISVAAGANGYMKNLHIDKALPVIKESEYVLLQNEIPGEVIEYVLQKCHHFGVKTILNLAPVGDFKKEHLDLVHTLVVNEVEANSISGLRTDSMEDIIKSAGILLELGPKNVIITLGSRGSFVVSGNYYEKIPAYKVEALDSTAAGDVYCGSLAVAMVEGLALHKAIDFASAAAAICVTRLGAQPSAPYREEIDGFLESEE